MFWLLALVLSSGGFVIINILYILHTLNSVEHNDSLSQIFGEL
jgi:hypothetical protein